MKILGHEEIEKKLSTSIISGKIFPTWIFYGPYGVGKSSVAKNFAKLLLSDNEPNERINKLVDSRTHPDFFILEQRNDNVSIDEIRELMGKIRKKPSLSKRRVVLIENASYFNKNIYNAMLKILEEPPADTVIILICQNLGYIPRTLLSRAAKVHFNSLNDSEVEEVLRQNGIKNTKALTKFANGSPGYAMYLHEHDGIEIFNTILSIFESYENRKRKIEQLINDNDTFKMIKDMFIKLLSLYIETIVGNIDEVKYTSEAEVFRKIIAKRHPNIDIETKKVLDIISLLNKAESLTLDKSAVIMCAFEKFA